MNAEELRRGSAQAHGLGVEAVGAVLVDVRPSGSAETPAQ
jgi:hypothetical protein